MTNKNKFLRGTSTAVRTPSLGPSPDFLGKIADGFPQVTVATDGTITEGRDVMERIVQTGKAEEVEFEFGATTPERETTRLSDREANRVYNKIEKIGNGDFEAGLHIVAEATDRNAFGAFLADIAMVPDQKGARVPLVGGGYENAKRFTELARIIADKMEAKAAGPSPDLFAGLPLFELAPSVCGTLSKEDRAKMLADMLTCDLLRLPFPDGIALRFWVPDISPAERPMFVTFACFGKITLHPHDKSMVIPDTIMPYAEAKYPDGSSSMGKLFFEEGELPDDDGTRYLLSVAPAEVRNHHASPILDCCDALTTLLISLATRNVVKSTERNTRVHNKHKPSKPQFVGPLGAIYISTTRVEAPAVEDMEQEEGGEGYHGGHKRAHLRRGHAHTVLYGIGRRERRVQWFPAVWVNGDPSFTGTTPTEPRKYVVQHGRDEAA